MGRKGKVPRGKSSICFALLIQFVLCQAITPGVKRREEGEREKESDFFGQKRKSQKRLNNFSAGAPPKGNAKKAARK